LDRVLGLIMLAVYVAVVVGLAGLVTWGVVKIFPTERRPRDTEPPSDDGAGGGGRLYRRAKRGTA
jgi:hypothetical protein